MSASVCWIAWNEPIALPNWWRSLTYARVSPRAPRPEADERGTRERAPLRAGVLVELVGEEARGENGPVAVAEIAVGERRRGEVGNDGAGWWRSDGDEIVTVERDDDVRNRARRDESRDAARSVGATRAVTMVLPSTTPSGSAPAARASRRAATVCSTSGAGASRSPSTSTASATSSSPAPAPPTSSARAIPGAPAATSCCQRSGEWPRPFVRADVRTRAVALGDRREQIDERGLFVAQLEIHNVLYNIPRMLERTCLAPHAVARWASETPDAVALQHVDGGRAHLCRAPHAGARVGCGHRGARCARRRPRRDPAAEHVRLPPGAAGARLACAWSKCRSIPPMSGACSPTPSTTPTPRPC